MFSLGMAFLRPLFLRSQGRGMVHQIWSPPTTLWHIQSVILEPGKFAQRSIELSPSEDGVWNQSCHPTQSVMYKPSGPQCHLTPTCAHDCLTATPSKASWLSPPFPAPELKPFRSSLAWDPETYLALIYIIQCGLDLSPKTQWIIQKHDTDD